MLFSIDDMLQGHFHSEIVINQKCLSCGFLELKCFFDQVND